MIERACQGTDGDVGGKRKYTFTGFGATATILFLNSLRGPRTSIQQTLEIIVPQSVLSLPPHAP